MATARPIPLSPPVIIATLPCNLPLPRCFSSSACGRGFIVRGLVAVAGAAAAEASFLWAYDLRAPQVTVAYQRRRFRVRAAFFAAAERERAERWPATRFACLDNARLDAERWLSRLRTRFVARARFREGFLRRPAPPFVRSRF